AAEPPPPPMPLGPIPAFARELNPQQQQAVLAPLDEPLLVLAAAGLRRLGIVRDDACPLPLDVCLPAAGQGIVAIEGRADDAAVRAACAGLDDPRARACLDAERAFLGRLGGGCAVPAGALCEADGDLLRMRAWWDGSGRSADLEGSADDPADLGARAAEAVGAA
ncbi:MAG: hypothetical protein ACPG7S_06890, partial [Miltoncostaeaceae bacterium]